MLRNLLPFIIIIVVAQIIGYVKKQQRKAQQQRQTNQSSEQQKTRSKPQTRSKIEEIIEIFTTDPPPDEERTVLETSRVDEEDQIKETTPENKSSRYDNEFVGSEITPGLDEESFDEEKGTSKRRKKSAPEEDKTRTEPKPKPVMIAGMPLTPKNITQGIVISQILKRPDFK